MNRAQSYEFQKEYPIHDSWEKEEKRKEKIEKSTSSSDKNLKMVF